MKSLLLILSFLIHVVLCAQVQFGSDFVGGVDEFLGSDVALTPDGTRLVVPAAGANATFGEVRVYNEIPTGWEPIGNPMFGTSIDEFAGTSVDISDDGKRVAFGAHDRGNSTGRIYIYEESGGIWTQIGLINGINNEGFGQNMTISGDGKRVAGACWNGKNIRVYEESGGSWTQVGATIIGGFDGVVDFTSDGKRLAISHGSGSNLVRVYDESAGIWTQVGNDLVSTSISFGENASISADGKRIVLGEELNGFEVFEESGGTWSMLGAPITDMVGKMVVISGDGKSIVSSQPDIDQVRQYHEDGGIWTQVGTIVQGPTSGTFGLDLAINNNGSRFAIGDVIHPVPTLNSGLVQTYNSALQTSIEDFSGQTAGQMTIFPNPTTGNLSIRLSDLKDSEFTLTVTDQLGRIIHRSEQLSNGRMWEDRITLTEDGVYTVHIRVGGTITRQRVVVAR